MILWIQFIYIWEGRKKGFSCSFCCVINWLIEEWVFVCVYINYYKYIYISYTVYRTCANLLKIIIYTRACVLCTRVFCMLCILYDTWIIITSMLIKNKKTFYCIFFYINPLISKHHVSLVDYMVQSFLTVSEFFLHYYYCYFFYELNMVSKIDFPTQHLMF